MCGLNVILVEVLDMVKVWVVEDGIPLEASCLMKGDESALLAALVAAIVRVVRVVWELAQSWVWVC